MSLSLYIYIYMYIAVASRIDTYDSTIERWQGKPSWKGKNLA